MRRFLKYVIPYNIRKPMIIYARRIYHWTLLIRDTRGVSASDAWKLLGSFFVAPITSARDLHRWQDPLLRHDILVDVKNVGRFPVRARTDDLWHISCHREPSIFCYIDNNIKDGSVFVDAGANIGFYTVLASKRAGISGRVISIEMMPDTANILRETIRLNELQNVQVVENALFEKSGEMVEASVKEGSFGQASIIGTNGDRSVHVRTETLDNILHDIPAIDLIKMDLEGAELRALYGARSCLRRTRAVIFENNDVKDLSVKDLLESYGFHITDIGNRNNIAINMSFFKNN